jgi:hypothetical protein
MIPPMTGRNTAAASQAIFSCGVLNSQRKLCQMAHKLGKMGIISNKNRRGELKSFTNIYFSLM